MHKFFVAEESICGDKITILDKGQAHHIYRVLRFKINDKLLLSDAKGNEYSCVIQEISADKVVLLIKEKHILKKPGKVNLTVACGLPKKAKFEDIIDKLTQLGVTKIIPLKTERVVVKLDKAKEALRRLRWQKITLSAVQQCQRNDPVIIETIKDVAEVLQNADDYDLKIIPTLEGRRRALSEVFKQIQPKNILVLIGPEGDFTPEEVALAKKSGCIPVSLGDLVLRVETAAVAVSSYIKLGDGSL